MGVGHSKATEGKRHSIGWNFYLFELKLLEVLGISLVEMCARSNLATCGSKRSPGMLKDRSGCSMSDLSLRVCL